MKFPVDYRSRDFLIRQIRDTLAFYDPRVLDPRGGFFHCFMNNGEVFDPGLRTLVASCRFVFNYAKAYQRFAHPEYLARVRHGLAYLRNTHRNPETGGYAWKIRDGKVIDDTNHCYGLAFVLLAYACSLDSGVNEAGEWIEETREIMDRHLWSPEHGLYAAEADGQWNLTSYRGQNDNMHACEAMLAAYEATGETGYLDRSCLLAERMVGRIFPGSEGYVWEHYTTDWSLDLEYGRNDRSNHIRPWGVQTGHQTEWSKLLILLDRHRPETWRLARATDLFTRAMEHGWDREHGGLIYGFDLQGNSYDRDKYFWVQAESIAAAALLGERTGEPIYWDWYDRIWDYSFTFFVDHVYGAWYRILTPDNRRYDERKSYNNKADYHTMGACHEVLKVVERCPAGAPG